MSYDELWKTIAGPLTDLRKLGKTIPLEVMNDLHSARTLIQILRADPQHLEILPQVESYLESVEVYIVYATQETLGKEYVDAFMEKLGEVRERLRRGERVESGSASSRFVAGLPRGKPWIRIKVSDEVSRDEIEGLAEKAGLSIRMQDDGYLLLFGDQEKIKVIVKEITGRLRKKTTAGKRRN